MKNRNIPYGYCYENGIVAINQTELKVLRRIFEQYLQGDSLLDISRKLNEEEAEYLPGVIGWNKSRLMRIINDERYLGNDRFPAVISKAMHEEMRQIKEKKNTQKKTDRSADIFHLDLPVICAACGGIMHRRHDNRVKEQCRWMCNNQECKVIVGILDEIILQQITDKINMVIKNPDIIEIPEENRTQSDSVLKMDLEIERILESGRFDKTRLRKRIMECASTKYMEIDNTYYIASRLKADLEKASPLSEFSINICHQMVESIWLQSDKTLSLVLANGQKI